MIAALILVLSIAAFIKFFLYYTRAVIVASREHQISETVHEITGIAGEIEATQFQRLVQLIEICPARNDGLGIRAVRVYFGGLNHLLGLVEWLPNRIVSKIAAWIERERAACVYFAAVALDQRMAYSRTLFSNHMVS